MSDKKQHPIFILFFGKLIQIILFVMIQIIFIPLAIIGIIVAVYKEMGKSKKMGALFHSKWAKQDSPV